MTQFCGLRHMPCTVPALCRVDTVASVYTISPYWYVSTPQSCAIWVVKLCWLVHLAIFLVPICLYCLHCIKCGQLILRKIVQIVAARCILRLKCTKFSVGAPDTAGGTHRGWRWGGRKGRGGKKEGINLPHDRLETLAALYSVIYPWY